MKRICLAICAALVVSSCTPVDDFGLYWDKGFVDPALEGSWKKIRRAGEDPDSVPGPDLWRFTRNGTNYSLRGINPIDQTAEPQVIAEQNAANEVALRVRTLRIGKSLFLMQRDPAGGEQGQIVRYEVRRGVLNEYWINNSAGVAFVQAKYPTAKNIRKNADEGEYVVIGTFDDEVFRALSEIADNPRYWFVSRSYRKVP
jgi:hypothetical protein